MILTGLEASGFRNLEGAASFADGLNIFYGDNAQGKTNWLEAIYVLGSTKSFRTSQVRDCIRFGERQAIVRGEVRRGGVMRQQQIVLNESSKELYVSGKREPVTRYLGNLDVFVFSLEELDVIRGDPARRRRFLDRGIVTILPSYLGTLSQYGQVLKQKNRLLSEASESPSPEHFHAQIEAWNEQLIELGTRIHEARSDYVERLNAVLADNDQGRAVFGAERIGVTYRSQLEGKGDLARYGELFAERLRIRMGAEIAAGHALIGPHRDDLEITADGRDVARFGSAGQQRSALFLLDLAQIHIYNSVYEESPVLLIDDVDAELDEGRIEALVGVLEGRAQTFVSTPRRSIADRYRDRAAVHLVTAGRATRQSREGDLRAPAASDRADELEQLVRQLADEEDERRATL